ncbi:probable E3 ubiquitin-protein ligase HECTD2 isoform X1 [Folsomia candida]|uniref:probable E3 ubiquitin-protein ligase HECTD2 isoform X1 n=1 Tax=Folsomia candida TaxID=158441 RepID=UPI00160500BC|nr:probable E3 ubiquitin-protein ligase HECTD2 isoform X1 [Folsomia candida]
MDPSSWNWELIFPPLPRLIVLRPALVMTDSLHSDQDHHAVRDSPKGLGRSTNTSRSDSVTCPACHVTVTLSKNTEGRRRLVCPYCGATYNHHESQIRVMPTPTADPLRHLRLPIVQDGSGNIGSLMVGRLGGVSVGVPDVHGIMIRPGSTTSCTSLPPIAKEHEIRYDNNPGGGGVVGGGGGEDRTIFRIGSGSSETGLLMSNYGEEQTSREEFMQAVSQATKTGNYSNLMRFYSRTFDSYANICATFKQMTPPELTDPLNDLAFLEEPELNMELVYSVNDALRNSPSIVHKTVLKAIVNALLDDKQKLYAQDKVRALFIILQNPIFAAQSSYTVLAHVLRHVTSLPNPDHQVLVHWFRMLEVSRLRMLVRQMTQFVTIRQFPPADRSLPPLSKSKWWIPAAARVLALINAANNGCQPALLHYSEFYNSALDHVDLMQEYWRWQSPERPGQFSYCQYPFMLSIVAKRIILTKDAEHQMILVARRSLVAKVARHQTPQIDIFFLNINVRRNYLVADSLKEIASKQKDLKKKLRVSFVGEPGLDMGGLTKEWFLLLIRDIFQPEYGMFVYYPNSRCYWFSLAQQGSLREYNLIGVLMGLAVYNSIILDLHFPSICYRKLLSPPVVPPLDSAAVGVTKDPSIDDLAEIMPDVAHGLRELLKYEGSVEEDMGLSFQASLQEYDRIMTYNLKENGEHIPVTNENREEYVRLYLDWVLNTAIYAQFRAFYLGFHSVTASNALIMLRPEEVEMLVCGSPTLDLHELRKVTEYDEYRPDDRVIQDFWSVLISLPLELQKKFLLFTTGSDRIPVGGMGEMNMKISRMRDREENLPEAHTCFNQLILPEYPNKEVLKKKLIIAISNAEGFGLE